MVVFFRLNKFINGPGWAHGPDDYGFDQAGPGLGLEYMGPGWSGPRVGEPVANTGPDPTLCWGGGAYRPPIHLGNQQT